VTLSLFLSQDGKGALQFEVRDLFSFFYLQPLFKRNYSIRNRNSLYIYVDGSVTSYNITFKTLY